MKVRSHQGTKLVARNKSPQPNLHQDHISPLLKLYHRTSFSRGVPRHSTSEKVITVASGRPLQRPEDRPGRIRDNANEGRALVEARKAREESRVRDDNGRKAGEEDGETTEETSRPAIHSAG